MSSSSTAQPAAISAASSTAAASCATSCSRSARKGATTAGCGCRSSAGWSGSRSRARCRSPRSALADDLWSGEERGFRAHLGSGATTGVLKLVGIPLYGLIRTRSLSGALLVGLSANVLNQLDTRPGRALKAFALGSLLLRGAPRGAAAAAVLLAPYDLREMAMLGDSGSNTLGAVLGLRSVGRLTERQRWSAIAALAGLTLLGERRSLGELIERTPVFRELDAWGRQAV